MLCVCIAWYHVDHLGPMPEPLFGCVMTTLLFFTDGGDNMAKIQIITAMTMDGFLPTTEESLMQWVLNDAKGFPHTGTSVASTA